MFPLLYKKYIPNGVLKGTVSVLQINVLLKLGRDFSMRGGVTRNLSFDMMTIKTRVGKISHSK